MSARVSKMLARTRRGLRATVLLTSSGAVIGAAPALSAPEGFHITAIDASAPPIVRVGLSMHDATSTIPPISVAVNGDPVTGDVGVYSGRIGVSEPDPQVTVMLAVDTSESMAGAKLVSAREAAETMLAQFEHRTHVGLVTFGRTARVMVYPTRRHGRVRRALDKLSPSAGTHLYDGVLAASTALPTGAQRRVIVLLSDGADVGSRATLDDAIDAVRSAGAEPMVVGIRGPGFAAAPLRRLARDTHGTFAAMRRASDLPAYSNLLSDAIERPYWVEFRRSGRPGEGLTITMSVDGAGSAQARATIPPATGATAPRAREPRAAAATTPPIALPNSLPVRLGIGAPIGLAAVLLVLSVARARRMRYFARRVSGAGHAGTVTGATQRRRLSMARMESLIARLAGGTRPYRHVASLLERAALPIRASEFSAATAMLCGVVGGGTLVAGGPVRACAAGLATTAAPYTLVRIRARRRRNVFDRQLPQALGALGASLRAGHSLEQAMQAIANDMPDPLGGELQRVLRESRLGRPLDQALEATAHRIGSRDFEFVVTTIAIQRQIGGSLAEILDIVADTVRSRQMLRTKVRALTSMGRLSVWVLIALPLVIATAVTAINPGFIEPLFATTTGNVMLALAAVSIAIGGAINHRIVSMPN